MTASALVMLLAMVNAPQVEISTIEGVRHSGTLTSVDAISWKIEVAGKPVEVAMSSILEARLQIKGDAAPAPPHETVLIDGSRIGTSSIALAGETLTISAAATDVIRIPRVAVGHIRLAESPSSMDEQWAALLERERREDWLVLQKQDKLDFVPGVISTITDQHVNLLLDGDTVPVPRAKVFGVILHQRQADNAKSSGIVELVSGDRLAVRSAISQDANFTLQLAAGPTVVIPMTSVRAFDFSADKLTWLSALKPRDIKHEFRFIDPAAPFKNDRDVWGDELQLGNRTFSRGICLRSKTVVRYRLNGDHSRFVALMGIQHGYAGDVHVEISADGQNLLSQDVTPLDETPFEVDLDISGKFILEILVDYGKVESDIGDHLVLAEARLLK
ncbi:MAG: NPCBM/NEW2 domain-containing protein [Rhodopirellula sp.]|nr:NPCBM/NEW2 domain-containing protein [Rhodopirellula sp.]